jgi:hypothetical protein
MHFGLLWHGSCATADCKLQIHLLNVQSHLCSLVPSSGLASNGLHLTFQMPDQADISELCKVYRIIVAWNL